MKIHCILCFPCWTFICHFLLKIKVFMTIKIFCLKMWVSMVILNVRQLKQVYCCILSSHQITTFWVSPLFFQDFQPYFQPQRVKKKDHSENSRYSHYFSCNNGMLNCKSATRRLAFKFFLYWSVIFQKQHQKNTALSWFLLAILEEILHLKPFMTTSIMSWCHSCDCFWLVSMLHGT